MFNSAERLSDYFNPRSPHGERREIKRVDVFGGGISIHAPRTGSDNIARHAKEIVVISIHAPRTGSDSTFCYW